MDGAVDAPLPPLLAVMPPSIGIVSHAVIPSHTYDRNACGCASDHDVADAAHNGAVTRITRLRDGVEAVAGCVGHHDSANRRVRDRIANHAQSGCRIQRYTDEVVAGYEVNGGGSARSERVTRQFQAGGAAHHRDETGIVTDSGIRGTTCARVTEIAVPATVGAQADDEVDGVTERVIQIADRVDCRRHAVDMRHIERYVNQVRTGCD